MESSASKHNRLCRQLLKAYPAILFGAIALALAFVHAEEPAVRSESPTSGGERGRSSSISTNGSKSAKDEKPRLRLTSSPQTIHGGIRIPTLIMIGESNKFSLLPPQGWRVGSDAANKRLQLTRPLSGSNITVDLIEEIAGRASEHSPEALKRRILSRYPEAKAVDQLFLSGLGRTGPALDLEWRTASGSLRRSRAGIIPFAGGCLECALTGSADQITQDYSTLNQLLLSFRQAPLDGKLDLPIVTPE